MVLAKSCGITSVVALLADMLGASAPTLRQQLREWYYDSADKKGKQRQEVDVTVCFGPLLGWCEDQLSIARLAAVRCTHAFRTIELRSQRCIIQL